MGLLLCTAGLFLKRAGSGGVAAGCTLRTRCLPHSPAVTWAATASRPASLLHLSSWNLMWPLSLYLPRLTTVSGRLLTLSMWCVTSCNMVECYLGWVPSGFSVNSELVWISILALCESLLVTVEQNGWMGRCICLVLGEVSLRSVLTQMCQFTRHSIAYAHQLWIVSHMLTTMAL